MEKANLWLQSSSKWKDRICFLTAIKMKMTLNTNCLSALLNSCEQRVLKSCWKDVESLQLNANVLLQQTEFRQNTLSFITRQPDNYFSQQNWCILRAFAQNSFALKTLNFPEDHLTTVVIRYVQLNGSWYMSYMHKCIIWAQTNNI